MPGIGTPIEFTGTRGWTDTNPAVYRRAKRGTGAGRGWASNVGVLDRVPRVNVRIGVDSLVVVLALIAVVANPPVAAADDLAPPPQMQSARDLFNDQPKGLSDHVVAWKLIYTGETFANLWGGR